jgi:plastocyanin
MTDDLERQLADLLDSRATELRPTPSFDPSVAARVRRRRTARLAAAGAALVLTGTGAAVAFGATMRGDTATQVTPANPGGTATPLPDLVTHGPIEDDVCGHPPSDTLALSVAGEEIKFSTGCLVAPTGRPVTIHFTNSSRKLRHNAAVVWDDLPGRKAGMAGTDLLDPSTRTKTSFEEFVVPELPVGDYKLVCKVHANMAIQYHVVDEAQ